MSYFLNRQELLKKPKDRYHNCRCKEKADKYYIANNEVLKENPKTTYRNFLEEEKEAKI